MAGKREGLLPKWLQVGRGKAAQPPAAATCQPTFPRPQAVPHHWLSVLVARPGPHDPVPVPDARVVVRPFPTGATRPGEVVARGTTGPDGTVSLLLPEGRYAVAARDGEDGRNATITLEHAGRALLLLESLGKRVVLTIEASTFDGRILADAAVDVRTVPTGSVAARSVTDADGVCNLKLPPGAYEVRIGATAAKTYVETDTLLRVSADPAGVTPEAPPDTKYAQRIRAATNYVATYDVEAVREDLWN